ncbi:MAG TPA: 1-phosphofructokinase family hexose kinase [Tepidisphaeraceae bacterium]|jgi:1-phosphofructokinase family hexose kinase|nr:1-phosphofructokinase family hexose kinase [Tepidisphaeraceae bacterium]
MIICLGTTPAVQRVMVFKKLEFGEVNRAVEVRQGIAGKSVNVAKVLAALGKPVLASGFLGGERGEFIRQELSKRGIRHDFVTVGPQTRLCVTILDQGAGTITELVEESQAVEEGAWESLRAKMSAMLKGAKMLVLSGTLAGGARPSFYRECVEMGIPAIVDTQGKVLLESLKARPLVAKPNRKELGVALGVAVDSDADLRSAMKRLLELGARNAVITMGGDGAMAFDGNEFWHVTAPAVKAVNSVGSGDAFTAGLAAGLVDGQTLSEACRLGAACGAANALTLMAGEVRTEDVQRLVSQTTVTRV